MNFLLHQSDHAEIQSLWEQCSHCARIIKSERSIKYYTQQYELYWNNPQGASRAFLSILALVLAIGVCFISEADADELQLLAPQWIAGAQFWLTESFEKFSIDLSVLQVSTLLLLARQTVPDPSELGRLSPAHCCRTRPPQGGANPFPGVFAP